MADTLPALLAGIAERSPKGVALRQKRLGIWHEITWAEYHRHVQAMARGLLAMGLRPGDVVALVGGHRPEWLVAEMGTMAAGGVAAPLFDDAPPAELAAMLSDVSARYAVVEGQQQVDRLLDMRARLPSLERVLYWDPRGMRGYSDAWLRPLWEVTGELPPAVHRRSPTAERPAEVSPSTSAPETTATPDLTPDAVAEILHTPGGGGVARPVRLTHARLIAAARAMVERAGITQRDDFISFTPNAWIGDRVFATTASLLAGYPVSLPEEPETVPVDLQEIGPRLVVAPPLAWQLLETSAVARIAGAGRLRRWVHDRLLAEPVRSGRRPGLLGRLLVANPIRDHLGLLHARHAYSTGAPVPESTASFFSAIGVPLSALYLLTEAGGPVALTDDTVFHPLPGFTLHEAPDGEIEVSSTADPIGGRIVTGDLGHIEADGALVVEDRKADVTRLVDGVRVVPAEIERRLLGSPLVRHAVVVAGGRPYVSALIAVDPQAANSWAEHHGFAVTTYRELSQLPQLREALREVVRAANERLSPSVRVQRFAILDRQLSIAEGELTRLRVPRRSVVLSRWSALVDTLYGVRPSSTGPSVVALDERAPATVGG